MAEANPAVPCQHQEFLRLDLDNPADKDLADYGSRVLRLLKSKHAQKSDSFVATLDDFLGVLYALIFAKYNDHPFEGREGPIDVQIVVKRAEDVAQGIVKTSGNWLAGFYFNSALFRIAATYHRGLKVVSGKTNRDSKKPALVELVERDFPDWQHTYLDKVCGEVNDLKHTADGLFNSRSVTRKEANVAVAELLELFELWTNSRGL